MRCFKSTARLRGLEPKGPIQQGVKDKAEISQYLNERVQAEYAPGEIEKEGKILRTLGLIPAEMDYRGFVIKLLTEQVGGFYDSDKKTFFIASWLPSEEQKPVMIHELTHALQDQHFDVGKMLKEDRSLQNDDRILAHQAVMEGDGMVVMLQYFLEPVKRHFSQVPDLASVMQAQMMTMQAQFPVFKEAPLYLRESLLFPYGYGASFLQYVWRKNPSWESVNKIYSDMPVSTEQIMHPEKYYGERDMPKPVNTESFVARLGPGWKIAEQKCPRRVLSWPSDVSAPYGGTLEESGGWMGRRPGAFAGKRGRERRRSAQHGLGHNGGCGKILWGDG